MNSYKKYYIVTNSNIRDIEKEISLLLKYGWQTVGGLTYTAMCCSQALIRDNPIVIYQHNDKQEILMDLKEVLTFDRYHSSASYDLRKALENWIEELEE